MVNTRKQSGARVRRCFEPELATRMLPLVKAVATDVVRQWGVVRDLNERLGTIPEEGDGPSVYLDEVRQQRLHHRNELRRLREYMAELAELGLEPRDAGRGVVHFPAEVEGQECYLCWKLGEEEVVYWHPVRTACSARRSLTAGSAAPSGAHDEPGLPDGSLSD